MMLFAQALVERGMLDGLILQVGNFAGSVTTTFQERPWLWAVVVLGVVLLLRKGKA
jgi:hypothetical protein